MNLRQAAEMALEALVWEVGSCPEMYAKQTAGAITALRAALAETDEPVAWHYEREGESAISFSPDRDPYKPWQPLYTHPPRREPVAWRTEAAAWLRRQANDAELESFRTGWANPARQMPSILRRMAKKLDAEQEDAPYGWDGYQKGKEYPPPQEPAFAVRAEAEEPVAWRYKIEGSEKWRLSSMTPNEAREWNDIVEEEPLYTHPPRREPLTEEEVRRLYREAWTPESEADEVLAFARAIERAIWEKCNGRAV